jgi:uncharacterized phage-associated protein
MSLPYQAISVAIYFLKLGRQDNISISPMKLQKLIYFAHGWCLAIKGEPLIQESVEAWKFGPVIDSIYYEFREFGSKPITIQSIPFDCDFDDLKKDKFAVKLVKKIWEVYKGYSAFTLSKMTHLPGTPWREARKGDLDKKSNVTIDDKLIREYFVSNFSLSEKG